MINKLIRKLVLKEKASPERYAEYLREKGVELGKNVRFYSPSNTLVDLSAPWLISIGDNSKITHGVIILTHDYSWAVLKKLPGREGNVLGAQSPVVIGKNVFIGMNAIITRGVTIGDNVIVGAGSVVTRDCECNCVYAGNPAKKIMTIDEFYEKRASRQFDEAKKLALRYKNKFGKNPPKEIFSEYFMLFCSSEEAVEVPVFMSQMRTNDNLDKTIDYMENNEPLFKSYEDFLTACFEDK